MDVGKRLQQIATLLAQDMNTFAAKESCGLIEFSLREFIRRQTPRLKTPARLKVQQVELQVGKGQKGIEEFTMGQLVGVLRESKFFAAWHESTGRDIGALAMINLGEVVKLRNRLIHDSGEASRADAELLHNVLRTFLEAFGIMSLDEATASAEMPAVGTSETLTAALDPAAAATEYEQGVRDALSDDGVISPIERRFLEGEASKLGLSPAQTEAIESAVLSPPAPPTPPPLAAVTPPPAPAAQTLPTQGESPDTIYESAREKLTDDEPSDVEATLATVRPLAEGGHAGCQWLMAHCFWEGLGVAEDGSAALEWLRKSAAQDFVDAVEEVGFRYWLGDGLKEDEEEGLRLIERAAGLGSAMAQSDIGRCYESGSGRDRDIQKALKLYEAAAEQGLVEAMTRVGLWHLRHGSTSEDLEKADETLRAAYEEDDPEATFHWSNLMLADFEYHQGSEENSLLWFLAYDRDDDLDDDIIDTLFGNIEQAAGAGHEAAQSELIVIDLLKRRTRRAWQTLESVLDEGYDPEDLLEELVGWYVWLANDSDVYHGMAIPSKKEGNALHTFLAPFADSEEDVLLYYDSTMFGKGDDGLAIGSSTLSWKTWLEEPNSISLDDPALEGTTTYETGVQVGDEQIAFTVGDDLRGALADLLRAVHRVKIVQNESG
jgi:TPR repeat protein